MLRDLRGDSIRTVTEANRQQTQVQKQKSFRKMDAASLRGDGVSSAEGMLQKYKAHCQLTEDCSLFRVILRGSVISIRSKLCGGVDLETPINT